jgi:thioredoxin reductase
MVSPNAIQSNGVLQHMARVGTTPPLSVAVIGAGPSGLFFCHAMEFMMKQTGRPIHVTCFEKSSEPGGIWRAAPAAAGPGSIKRKGVSDTRMYEQLWSNGASHLTEFFDYTYDDHFGRPVSVYMKRQDLLDYVIGRVKRNCPDFMEKYVQFQTVVENVVYDDTKQRFDISVKRLDVVPDDSDTPMTEIKHFDKCIWACGENGRQDIPESLVRLLREGGYQGRIIHSADTARLEEDVKGKKILLIGGGLSAEDLALQAIKLQVKKVYISSRKDYVEVSAMNHWPMNKVEILQNQALLAVTDNGRCFQFMEVEWTPQGYERDGDHIETKIRGIDTVIFCTGYYANLEMLDPSLRQNGFPEKKGRVDKYINIPHQWKMPPNIMSAYTGDVKAGNEIRYHPLYSHPNYYRGVLISNPNMMFITTYGSEVPLMACDAYAWLLAGYVSGYVHMPTMEEMRETVDSETLELLKFPFYRYEVDKDYYEVVEGLEDFWPDDPEQSTPWDEVENEEFLVTIRMLARVMREGKYPFNIGTFENLNAAGDTIAQYGLLEDSHRENLKPVGQEKNWKTFRDVDDPDKFCSFFTGTKAVALEKPWMEIDHRNDK